MARDRQRSKARQRARAQQESRGRRPRRTDAPESGLDDATAGGGLDDATVEESGLVAPGFENNPEAEMVEMAEAGVPLPEEETQREDRAPDALEIPTDLQRPRRGALAEEQEVPRGADKDRSRIGAFLAGCIEELRRVQWPDRPAVFQATAVVLGFVLVAGGYLGLMDAIWQPLINAIL